MFVFIVLFLLQITACFGFYFITPDNYYFLFLWIPLGLIAGWLVLVILIFTVIYPFLRFTKPTNRLKHEIIYQFCWFANHLFKVSLKVKGRENIPNETFVAFANHKSMLDVSLVYVGCHCVMSAVAKKTLAGVGIIRMFMNTIRVIPLDRENDRQGVKDLLSAIHLVEENYNFMIFPEGGIKTRETELIETIKPGAFKLATKPQASVLPISIIGSSQCSKRSPWRRTKIKMVIHKAIPYEEYKDLSTQELGEQVKEIINSGVLDEKKS